MDFAKALGIDAKTKAILDTGSRHKYDCRCEGCRKWWKTIGPDEEGNFGPFTPEEIKECVIQS